MPNSKLGSPRRGMDSTVEVIETIENPAPARARRSRFAFRKTTVTMTLAATIAVGTLFGYAFHARTSYATDAANEGFTNAVPAAAAKAAEEGFVDRSEDVSRNAMREVLNEAVAEQSLKSRDDREP